MSIFGKKKSVKVLLQYLIVCVTDEEDLMSSVPEPKKRTIFECPSCKPSRSFSDEKKLIEHIDVSHFFDQLSFSCRIIMFQCSFALSNFQSLKEYI